MVLSLTTLLNWLFLMSQITLRLHKFACAETEDRCNDDRDGKKGDTNKQLQAALAYVKVQRLFAQALRGQCIGTSTGSAAALLCLRSPSAHICMTRRRRKYGITLAEGREEKATRCVQAAQGLAGKAFPRSADGVAPCSKHICLHSLRGGPRDDNYATV